MVAWVALSIGVAALLAPWLYGWGKDFAAAHHGGEGFWAGIAGSCERAKFSRYFNRSLMLSALLLLWPLWLRLKQISSRRERSAPVLPAGLPREVGVLHAMVGFAAAAGLLWILGRFMVMGGAFVPSPKSLSVAELLEEALAPALGASLVEEWLFRALLLGLWLRISGPLMACVGSSLLFAFVHFLDPADGVRISDPQAWHSGFVLLGLIFKNYLSPAFVTTEVLTLFAVGLSLAWARLKTASLWLPFGMHAGWIFAYKAFNLCHGSGDREWLGPMWIGPNLRSGLLPLATLLATWIAVAIVLKWLPGEPGKRPFDEAQRPPA